MFFMATRHSFARRSGVETDMIMYWEENKKPSLLAQDVSSNQIDEIFFRARTNGYKITGRFPYG